MAKIDKYNMGLDLPTYDYKDKKQNLRDYVNYMLARSIIMFKYHNLPESMPQREIEILLQTNGFGCVCKINGELYCLNGGLGGEGDAYNRPTEIVISNPYLKYNETLHIDTDCIIIPNDSLYMGLIPLYNRYCTMLVENDITMILATVNKRVQNLLSANDDSTVESAKDFLKNVFEGKLGVIAESRLFDSLKVNNSTVNSTVSMKELFEFEQYTKASLYNEIGLSANYNMKRERLTSAEVEANTDNLYPLVDDMLNSRRKALEKINTLFGTDIQVEFNSSWDYRLFNGASVHNTEEETTVEEIEETTEEPTAETDVETVEEVTEEETTETEEETTEETETETTDETDTETEVETEEETETETEEETTDETAEEESEENDSEENDND